MRYLAIAALVFFTACDGGDKKTDEVKKLNR